MRRPLLLLTTMVFALLLASGVALAVNKVGTNGPDTLRGTNGDDNLLGKEGNDDLYALNGRDTLLGGPGKDVVVDKPRGWAGGDKILLGGPGNDIVVGGRGSDIVLGDAGNDFLIEDGLREFSEDKLSGGPGNDVLDVFHKPAAVKDVIVCGSGFDRVISDRADLVAPDCEKVVVTHGSKEEVLQQADRFFESIPPSFFEGLQPGAF